MLLGYCNRRSQELHGNYNGGAFWSLIIHDHTLEQDKEEKENTKKDLRLLVDEDNSDLDQEMTHITKNFKWFLKKKVGSSSQRFKKGDDKAKEHSGSKAKESNKKIIKDNVRWYRCKGFRHLNQ